MVAPYSEGPHRAGNHYRRRWKIALAAGLTASAAVSSANAGYTETAPEGTLFVDVGFSQSWMLNRFNNDGELAPYIDKIERFEPGGDCRACSFQT